MRRVNSIVHLKPEEFKERFKDIGPETLYAIYGISPENSLWWPSCSPSGNVVDLPQLVIPLKVKESS